MVVVVVVVDDVVVVVLVVLVVVVVDVNVSGYSYISVSPTADIAPPLNCEIKFFIQTYTIAVGEVRS